MEDILQNDNRNNDNRNNDNNDGVIKIYMLGRFALEYNGKTVLEDEGKIHKVWTLLAYLLANHKRNIMVHELPELLCGDDRSNNPAKAVKNLVYRLRCMLAESDLPKAMYILQNGGIYSWNTDLNYSIDLEEFVSLLRKAKELTLDEENAIPIYLQAISTYKGKFLPHSIYDEWAVNTTTYYHRLFTECIEQLYLIAEKKRDFAIMLHPCEKAIGIDRYDETIYKIYIHCLVELGRHKEALAAYEAIISRIYDELGVNPSQEMRELYREIIKTVKSVEVDLIAIKEDLNESEKAETCYFCEYQIFKDVYRLIARRVNRTGQSIYIMLCTLTDNDGEIPEAGSLSDAMAVFKEIVGTTLRKGDLFARYSNAQFVVMLLDTTYENGCMVGKRLESVYKKNKISKKIWFHCKLQPLDPKEF